MTDFETIEGILKKQNIGYTTEKTYKTLGVRFPPNNPSEYDYEYDLYGHVIALKDAEVEFIFNLEGGLETILSFNAY